ncbi:MAG: MotA/TolQ/ExbB proton channel family protein [Gammaproteobacteria bacterium]|nr:MotA/TolQ/ExbB proton channel family protein [Gammaproteobacteria bacterium]
MKSLRILSLLLLLPSMAWADTQDVDALVESVRQEALKEAEHDEQRIDRFLADRQQQRELLADAKAQLAAANQRADRLRNAYEGNEATLTQYAATLEERAGDLNDLFAIVRQAALSADNVLESSLVAAEQVQRSSFLQDIGKGETTPTIDNIKRLWTTVLTEISESGKVVRFNATLIKPQGDELQQVVTRAGVFTSVSDGAFLRYLPDSGKLVELSRQPAPRFQRMAQKLQDAESGMVAMALDPSKGAILSLMVQSPDLKERVRQGGSIGYLILFLGAIGVIIVIRRGISLLLARRAMDKQAIHKEASNKNALGRLKLIAVANDNESMTSLGIRLDEALAEEASFLNRGLATVAVLAAVSPLLGLLGTVTGMIETFQSITLFGTGDPKLMSGGISQALITTQLGLAVAIPLVLFHSLLTGRANRLVERLGKYSSDLLTDSELD